MRVVGILVLALILVHPSPARAQGTPPFSAAFSYDALADTPVCPISADQQKAYFLDAASHTPVGAKPSVCGRPAFEVATGLTLFVLHARFGADYSSIACSANDLGSGVLEPRGLQDVTPLALGSLGTPVAHGGVQPSSITITPLTPAMVLAQLIDPVRMNQPQLTLEAQWTDIERARHTLDTDVHDLIIAIDRMRTGAPATSTLATDCGAISGAPSIEGLNTCMQAIAARIASDNSLSLAAPVPGPPGPPAPAGPCVPANGSPGRAWDGPEFLCVVGQIDARLTDLTVIRDRLAVYGFSGAADRVVTESDQLIARLHTFDANLNVIERAVADFANHAPGAAGFTLDGSYSQAMRELRRAEIKKQLKDRYGTQLDDAELNQLVTELIAASSSDAFRSRFRLAIAGLLARTQEYRGLVNAQIASVTTQAASVVTARDQLTAAVDLLNRGFAGAFTAINNVYLTKTEAAPIAYPIKLADLPGSNRDVFCELTITEKFKPYRFAAVASTPAPVPAGLIVPAPSTASASVAPANLPQSLPRRFTFETHKLWHANIVSGFVFSSLRNVKYRVRTQDSVIVATLADDQRPVAHYLLGFNYYLKPRDTFWRSESRPSYWIPGIMFGIGMESSKQFFLGPNFEPTLGVDFSIGWHFGEQDALPINVVADKTALPADTTTAPTRTVMKSGVYAMFGFDVNTFRRLLGLLSPVGGQ